MYWHTYLINGVVKSIPSRVKKVEHYYDSVAADAGFDPSLQPLIRYSGRKGSSMKELCCDKAVVLSVDDIPHFFVGD